MKKIWLALIITLLLPVHVMTSEINLNEFSVEHSPTPEEFNDNFLQLKNAYEQLEQETENLKYQVNNAQKNSTRIDQLQKLLSELSEHRKNQNLQFENLPDQIDKINISIKQLREDLNNLQKKIMKSSFGKKRESPLLNNASSSRQPEFINDIIKIQAIGVREGPGILLELKHTNITDQPIELFAVKHNSNTYLLDENSTQYSLKEAELSDRGSRLEIPPKGQRVIIFKFKKPESKALGKQFALYSKYGYSEVGRNKLNYFYVQLKGIVP